MLSLIRPLIHSNVFVEPFFTIAGSARGRHYASPVLLLASRAGKKGSTLRNYLERKHKVRNVWTMSAMELQKATEKSQNKEKLKRLLFGLSNGE